MAIKMAHGSVFAVLLRSPWWYSALIGVVILAISLVVGNSQVAVLVISCSLPFFGIAGYAAFKQSQQPSRKRVLEVAQEARELSAIQIAAKIAENYTKVRYDCDPFKGKAADLVLERGNKKFLLCSKRFKAANTGIEPLKQLVSAGENAEATGYLYVALGEISAAAQEYAASNNIELIQPARLAAYFDGQAGVE